MLSCFFSYVISISEKTGPDVFTIVILFWATCDLTRICTEVGHNSSGLNRPDEFTFELESVGFSAFFCA